MVQKIIQRISYFFSHLTHDVMKKFRIMDKYERMIIIWSGLVFLMVLFTPLMTISSNEIIDQWLQYVFLITKVSLWKSFLFIEWTLILSLLWLFNNKFKVYVVENLWFQWDNYLFLCFLFTITSTTFISIWEIVNVFTAYTMVLSLTAFYYLSVIILILLLALCFYLSFYKSNKYFKWHVVWYHGKKDYKEVNPDWSLFESLSHDD